ncbi:hypothetical protein VUR80DRAFT_6329 [Thermomyces stellatus]
MLLQMAVKASPRQSQIHQQARTHSPTQNQLHQSSLFSPNNVSANMQATRSQTASVARSAGAFSEIGLQGGNGNSSSSGGSSDAGETKRGK